MRLFVFMPNVNYLGESCFLVILLGRISIAFSRMRFRVNIDITL